MATPIDPTKLNDELEECGFLAPLPPGGVPERTNQLGGTSLTRDQTALLRVAPELR
jgi:hypothetical protein